MVQEYSTFSLTDNLANEKYHFKDRFDVEVHFIIQYRFAEHLQYERKCSRLHKSYKKSRTTLFRPSQSDGAVRYVHR